MPENEKELKTPESKLRANQRYEQRNVEHLAVRVPKGKVTEIRRYVTQKKKEEMFNPMYESVNAFVIALIEKETGLYIKGIQEELEEYEYLKGAYNEWIATDPLNIKDKNKELLEDEEYQEFLNIKLRRKWQQVQEIVVRDYRRRKVEEIEKEIAKSEGAKPDYPK